MYILNQNTIVNILQTGSTSERQKGIKDLVIWVNKEETEIAWAAKWVL